MHTAIGWNVKERLFYSKKADEQCDIVTIFYATLWVSMTEEISVREEIIGLILWIWSCSLVIGEQKPGDLIGDFSFISPKSYPLASWYNLITLIRALTPTVLSIDLVFCWWNTWKREFHTLNVQCIYCFSSKLTWIKFGRLRCMAMPWNWWLDDDKTVGREVSYHSPRQ